MTASLIDSIGPYAHARRRDTDSDGSWFGLDMALVARSWGRNTNCSKFYVRVVKKVNILAG